MGNGKIYKSPISLSVLSESSESSEAEVLKRKLYAVNFGSRFNKANGSTGSGSSAGGADEDKEISVAAGKSKSKIKIKI